MCLRVEIAPEDRLFHMFLWREIFSKLQKCTNSASVYLMKTRHVDQFVTQFHAETHRSEYSLAAETPLKSVYKDDSMDSVTDDQQGIEVYKQLSQLWKGAGM